MWVSAGTGTPASASAQTVCTISAAKAHPGADQRLGARHGQLCVGTIPQQVRLTRAFLPWARSENSAMAAWAMPVVTPTLGNGKRSDGGSRNNVVSGIRVPSVSHHAHAAVGDEGVVQGHVMGAGAAEPDGVPRVEDRDRFGGQQQREAERARARALHGGADHDLVRRRATGDSMASGR